jgi:ABC-type branched-subunit amino acid transport system ATPase component
MLKSIKIENFRGFKTFELQQLGRINLLVGTNNSGKTSVLEAIQLLCSPKNFEPLYELMNNRGEYFFSDDKARRDFDICHLFYGHDINIGSQFSISGLNNESTEKLVISIEVRNNSKTKPLTMLGDMLDNITSLDENEGDSLQELDFKTEWIHGEQKEAVRFPLSYNGGLRTDLIRRLRRDTRYKTGTQFVTSSSLTTEKMIELFDQVVLTPDEELVLQALQTIEPKIERIASISSPGIRSYGESRGGFAVRMSDIQRIPIGSMGDGIWRMLGLALATVCASDGVLFVDEIDTGLHFSTMSDMWKMIWETAKRLNLQVFATTHNSDCWRSLASIACREDATEDGITIQRIERGKPKAVAFTQKEIVIAAEREIEVR